jgi:hypothetical protein
MDRRAFLKNTAALAAVAGRTKLAHGLGSHNARGYYRVASATIPRHDRVEEVYSVLTRYKERGFTGIWVENDYLRWSWNIGPDQGFGGNWMLFNIFDFTFSKLNPMYRDYLFKLGGKCEELNLEFYGSFWLPKLNVEMLEYLRERNPQALGSCILNGKPTVTLCTCRDGGGLAFIEEMVSRYVRLSPAIRALKVGTLDNDAHICDETCLHAHGTTRAQHLGNLYGSVQKAMLRERSNAALFVYEWFWQPGYLEEMEKQVVRPYFMISKMEIGTRQHLEALVPGSPLFDASSLTGEEGPVYKGAVQTVGVKQVADMPSLGGGIDDFFLGSPPCPGRLYRRMQLHRRIGCDKMIEFDCDNHWNDSNERAYAVFNREPDISQTALLDRVAAELYRRPEARKLAISGWNAFDRGFGYLPVGLGDTHCDQISGRFGMAWNMCIATPLVRVAFGDADQRERIHWFSPYNFFNSTLVDRLETQFLRVQSHWQWASRMLAAATALENGSESSRHESIAADGHLLAVASALNWCNACRYARTPALASSFDDLVLGEIDLTKRFYKLSMANPWLWSNICWHPHQTPMSQRYLGFEGLTTHNTFEAKLKIMGAS